MATPHAVVAKQNALERLLEAVTLVLGPGILTDYVLHSIGQGEHSQVVVIAVAAVTAAALYYKRVGFGFFTGRKTIAIPWLLVFALSLLLAVFIHRPLDKWIEWQKQVDSAVQSCQGDTCVAGKLDSLMRDRPLSDGVSKNSQLLGELLTGQLLLQNKRVADLLYSKLSIDERFIGSGFALPVGTTNFTSARIPEYLVPNLPQTSGQVWTWHLPLHPTYDLPLRDVLSNNQPVPQIGLSGTSPKSFSVDAIKPHLQTEDTRPTMVRFAVLTSNQYKGCIGKPSASRVFMMNLGAALSPNLTVGQAAHYSGYNFSPETASTAELYIWVFQPEDEREVVPATWGAVVSNFKTWASDHGCAIF